MPFAEVDEAMEARLGHILLSQLPGSQSLIIDYIRPLVVVIHSRGGFVTASQGLFISLLPLSLVSERFINAPFPVVEFVFARSLQFPFAQVCRVDVTLFQPAQRRGVIFSLHRLLHQAKPGELILRGDLPLATLPRVEFPLVYPLACLVVTSRLVQQCCIFQIEVIALADGLDMCVEERKACLIRHIPAFVELVQLHQYACVGGIQCISAFHQGNSLVFLSLFIEVCEREVAEYSRELVVLFRGGLPSCDGIVVLPLVIPNVS